MKVLLQRVSSASVTVDGRVVGVIARGLLALVGTTHGDDAAVANRLAERVAACRMFADAAGRTNLSVREVAGSVMVVPQFTLYADTKKGTRPSFLAAGPPEQARALVGRFGAQLEACGVRVERGVFGAHMEVALVNDGPFTIELEVLAS